MPKHLIVNADDLGLSEGVNQGIFEAAEHGIVTSASLMVRQEAAASAARRVRHGSQLSVGLHLDLGEWVFRDNEWVPLYSVVPTKDAKAVEQEIGRQLSEFRRLVGRDPTHIDSHQHALPDPNRHFLTNPDQHAYRHPNSYPHPYCEDHRRQGRDSQDHHRGIQAGCDRGGSERGNRERL